MTDFARGLTHGWPNDEWILDGDSYEGLMWLSATPKPSKKEIQAASVAAEKTAEDKAAAKAAARESAVAKLAALGLSVDEVEAILGGSL